MALNVVDTHSPITDEVAREELFRLRMQNWRIQLVGATVLTALVASVFDAYVQDRRFWIWTGVGWTIFGTQAWLCTRMDRIQGLAALPRWWWRSTLALTLCVGVLWSSLAATTSRCSSKTTAAASNRTQPQGQGVACLTCGYVANNWA